MDEKQLLTLAEEIKLPAYSDLSDDEIAESLNSINKLAIVPSIVGVQFGQLIDFNDFKALPAERQTIIASLWGLESIPLDSGFFLALILDTFADGSLTRNNLSIAFTKPTSRAVELGLGKVGPHHVKEAREFGAKVEAQAVNDGK